MIQILGLPHQLALQVRVFLLVEFHGANGDLPPVVIDVSYLHATHFVRVEGYFPEQADDEFVLRPCEVTFP